VPGCGGEWPAHKINADGRNVAFRIGVIGESQEEAGLSDTRVTNKQEFEEIVVSAGNGPSVSMAMQAGQ
jgi:hypothetical protein